MHISDDLDQEFLDRTKFKIVNNFFKYLGIIVTKKLKALLILIAEKIWYDIFSIVLGMYSIFKFTFEAYFINLDTEPYVGLLGTADALCNGYQTQTI